MKPKIKKSDLDEIDDVLSKANSSVNARPKPPTLNQMIRTICEHVVQSREALRHVADVAASAGAESGKLYNRFESFESRRELELRRHNEELMRENNHLRSRLEAMISENQFLRGRSMTLEQVAKIEPLRPLDRLASDPDDPSPIFR